MKANPDPMEKPFIKDLDYQEAEDLFQSLGLQGFRARQLFNWLYERNAVSFHDMTDFSKDLRNRLQDTYILSPLEMVDRQVSQLDGTEKFLFKTTDDHYIESVLLKNDGTEVGRLTICISSQVGCAMGCTFCATGQLGFHRNLTPGEILDQVSQVRRETGLVNNNVVFMGMGEPFMNYDNVLKAADIMNYSYGFHLSVRKITLSTCGITPMIERFIDEKRPYNLALSLNDTLSEKRSTTMPIEKKYPFREIADLLNRKFPVSRNRLTIEYVMRKDNISREDALRIKKMFRFSRIKLNLIPLNSLDDGEIPTAREIEEFLEHLQVMNVPVSIRKSLGRDIQGACGQLSGSRYAQAL